MATSQRIFPFDDYTVAIVCALDKELFAVRALFDSHHTGLPSVPNDPNHYVLGRIAEHNVVATCLPSGEYGTNSAAGVVSHLVRTFPSVQCCLLVGIGGGVPSKHHDIRLGDVVISHPLDGCPGVIQHDLGKETEDGKFVRTGELQNPPRLLMAAINNMKSDPELPRQPLKKYLDEIGEKNPVYKYQREDQDVLFASDAKHNRSADDCAACSGPRVARPVRSSPDHPKIFYGPIASGNKVVKNAKLRDKLRDKYKILCVEMEGAGIMNSIPSLVIRGICDYADSHKNKIWQEYASAAAASYAKLLLTYLKPSWHGTRDVEEPGPRTTGCTATQLLLPAPCDKTQVLIQEETEEEGPRSSPAPSSTASADAASASTLDGPLTALQPCKSAVDRLLEIKSFARRRPSWDNWPINGMPLLKSLQHWMSAAGSHLLVIGARPATSIDKKRTRDLAFEIIEFIQTTTSYPVRFTLSLQSDPSDTASESLRSLISQSACLEQCLDSFPTPEQEYSDEDLFSLLHAVYSKAKEEFVVIETPNQGLTERLLSIFHEIVQSPSSAIKVLVFNYGHQASSVGKFSNDISVETVMLPHSLPPSHRKSAGKRRTLWRQLNPSFTPSSSG